MFLWCSDDFVLLLSLGICGLCIGIVIIFINLIL